MSISKAIRLPIATLTAELSKLTPKARRALISQLNAYVRGAR